MSGPGSITLNLSLQEYNDLQAAKTRAEAETAEVRAQLEAAKFINGDERVAKVTAFARDCLTLARFAIANCPPEMIRGWPYEELRRIADTIDVLPDYSLSDRDMSIDLHSFARDCEAHEIRRRAEPKSTKLTPAEVAEHRQRLENDPVGKMLMDRMNPDRTP